MLVRRGKTCPKIRPTRITTPAFWESGLNPTPVKAGTAFEDLLGMSQCGWRLCAPWGQGPVWGRPSSGPTVSAWGGECW